MILFIYGIYRLLDFISIKGNERDEIEVGKVPIYESVHSAKVNGIRGGVRQSFYNDFILIKTALEPAITFQYKNISEVVLVDNYYMLSGFAIKYIVSGNHNDCTIYIDENGPILNHLRTKGVVVNDTRGAL